MTQFVNIVLQSKFFPPLTMTISITYEISFNATT